MESAVMNLFTAEDKVLIVNGGSFGARFVKICQIHGIPWEEISLSAGQPLREEELNAYVAAAIPVFWSMCMKPRPGFSMIWK